MRDAGDDVLAFATTDALGFLGHISSSILQARPSCQALGMPAARKRTVRRIDSGPT